MKYKLTFNTKQLKEAGYNVNNVRDYLIEYGDKVIDTFGSSIIFDSTKSSQGLYQELRRVFNTIFKINEY